MIKEALQYLVGLKANKTYVFHDEVYSDNDLVRIPKVINRPNVLMVHGLDSIVKLVKKEIEHFNCVLPVYIGIDSADEVTVFTGYDEEMKRLVLYSARCDVPGFFDGFREYEKCIIQLRSKFIPNAGTEYLLDLLSRISKENGVQTSDNGVTQVVEGRSGIGLKANLPIKPRVPLKPFRTFLEVDQPESEFLVRVDNEGNIGLFEADGGMWKIEAKQNVADYFRHELEDLISAGNVIVMV